jgi:hypothetical protein
MDTQTDAVLGLRVEWLKCRARAYRWHEEVALIEEEMRRVLVYCGWKEKWWIERAGIRQVGCSILQEGIRAYALQQSSLERQRRLRWATQWAAVRERGKVVRDQLGTMTGEDINLPPIVIELSPDDECDAERDCSVD